MINVLKKKKCVIYAPANGKVVDLSKVPDPVFSKKMMGEGVGLIFEGDTLFAPLDGKVKLVASTKHAIGFEANNKGFGESIPTGFLVYPFNKRRR